MDDRRPSRLLLVENHAVFAATVTTCFLAAYDVVTVPSRAAARRALEGSRFDVALVDYDLDDCKGDEIVRLVRASWPKMVVVGISSHDAGNEALRRAGATACLAKASFAQIGSLLARLSASPPGAVR